MNKKYFAIFLRKIPKYYSNKRVFFFSKNIFSIIKDRNVLCYKKTFFFLKAEFLNPEKYNIAMNENMQLLVLSYSRF